MICRRTIAAVQVTRKSNYFRDGNALLRILGWARGEAIPGRLYCCMELGSE